ncbi:hypothetical protein KAFR_0A00180 [Kazachstania africana CBS 2517]|uniref:protein-tyrosine-phosphatase n=1 Tax=Kazachstania africana (strain ATCC 22294 / BCRC 22015 / CBS 2517 / CECT 1963 / NBRC 1671 / NRRL Y-8276) TaxID=1071382 RepID=H2AM56_KAZAF|nr:hypothetical protein KAFR_0A00180 [Kazachstania africana CBS 2517]CCF55456.1 hypothetical protein KAFR_0A00180 [Kazachstania africana CBS 2517]
MSETVAEPKLVAAPVVIPPHPDVTRVLGNIYISGIQPIVDHAPLKAQHNITHILSVMKFNVIPEYLIRKGYTLKNIPIDDLETEDILKYLNETNKYIDQCLFPNEPEYSPDKVDFKKKKQGDAVLIHCQAGSSRSVAFAVAYLMYRYKLPLKVALHAVKRKRSLAEPNPGFLTQLQLFEEKIGSSDLDIVSNKFYKQWALENSLHSDPTGANILSNDKTFRETKSEDGDLDKLDADELYSVTAIRCKKCRYRLALSTSFIDHEPPSKESSEGHFIRRAANSHRIIDIQESQSICSHFFVEPLDWMKKELQGKQELEGKFSCPGCETKVGGYNWKGSRCSCGKWVIPAIHLQSNKVDQFPLSKQVLPNMVNFKSTK